MTSTKREENRARFEELELEDKLKQHIVGKASTTTSRIQAHEDLDQARLIHGAKYPVGSTFSVLISSGATEHGPDSAGAWLLVHPGPYSNLKDWECIDGRDVMYGGSLSALEALLTRVEHLRRVCIVLDECEN
jgi:hypothetical protein